MLAGRRSLPCWWQALAVVTGRLPSVAQCSGLLGVALFGGRQAHWLP